MTWLTHAFLLFKNIKLQKFYIILTVGVCLLCGCSTEQDSKNKMETMNYDDAINYVRAYAKYQRIPFEDVFDIKTEEKFRGSVYNVEFEYNSDNKILIARGYVFQSKFFHLRSDILDKLIEIQNTPHSDATVGILRSDKLDFSNSEFEVDTTINEVSSETLFRLNIRTDFDDGSISVKDFRKKIKKLADEAYIWDKKYYLKVVDHCNITFFHNQARSYINSYFISKETALPHYNENEKGFSNELNDIQLRFDEKSETLFVTKEISSSNRINDELIYYNKKIANDPGWYWRSSLEIENDKIVLVIKIGDYSKTDDVIVEIIDHCVNNMALWKEELFKK